MTSLDLSALTIVGMIDPAGSKNIHLKKQRSSQSIIVVGSDHALGRAFVLEAWKNRVKIEKFVEQIFTFARRYPQMRRLGCEANAMQELFAGTTAMLAKAEGLRLPLEEVRQPTRITKEMRVRIVLQPMLAYGRLFIQPQHDELRKAILTFPQTELPLMDLVDCLGSAISLLPMRPVQRERDQSLEGLASYLRNTNVPPSIAEGRLQAFARSQGSARTWR